MTVEVAAFPLTVTSDEGVASTYATAREAELDLEFLDEWQWDYIAYDAKVRRTRVIIWNLELLVCQVVDEREDLKALEVWRVLFDGAAGLAERASNGALLRFAALDGKRVSPFAWDEEQKETTIQLLGPSEQSAAQFHRLWMKARTKKYP